MSYGDTYIRRVEESVDDEYQEEILFKAESVGFRYMYWGLLLTVAVLAWVLPGSYVFCSMIPICALVIGGVAESRWMKRYAPRPRAMMPTALETVMLVGFLAFWAAGALVNGRDFIYSDSLMSGLISGAFTGAVVGLPAAIIGMKVIRARDEKRLNAELDAALED